MRAAATLLTLVCAQSQLPYVAALESSASTLSFAGRTWAVKMGTSGPGPNTFTAAAVNVDDAGALHLRIAQDARGAWTCGEVLLNESLGYGTYTWTVASDAAAISGVDPNIVLGLFTYADDSHELDAEFSRWGNVSASANNGDFAVQPATPSNVRYYAIPAGISALRVAYTWAPGSVDFSATGERADGTPWRDGWTRSGASVPAPGGELVHINLWLFRGRAPSAGAEAIISNFSFAR